MSNFEKLGQQQSTQIGQLLQQIKANPAQMLQQRGLNIPAGMNNPNQIINHLIQSGQVPQNRLTQIMQMMGRR